MSAGLCGLPGAVRASQPAERLSFLVFCHSGCLPAFGTVSGLIILESSHLTALPLGKGGSDGVFQWIEEQSVVI